MAHLANSMSSQLHTSSDGVTRMMEFESARQSHTGTDLVSVPF